MNIDEVVETAFNYVVNRGFPFYHYSPGRKLVEFDKVRQCRSLNILNEGVIKQTMHGLGLAWSYFPHSWGVKCGNMKTPAEIFNDRDLLRKAIVRRLMRGGLEMIREDGSMTDSQIRKALRSYSGAQSVSNFRPSAALAIYNHFNAKATWDMSSGFGGRLLGALASGTVRKYIGTDPSSPTFAGLEQMAADFSWANVEVELHKCGSEDFIPNEKVDLCFTSPPYFNCEKYTEEPSQSWKRYQTTETWNEMFLRRTINNCRKALKNNGSLILNVANVKTHKTLEEDTVRIAQEEGFSHMTTIRMQLSSITKGGFKSEPLFVFSRA